MTSEDVTLLHSLIARTNSFLLYKPNPKHARAPNERNF